MGHLYHGYVSHNQTVYIDIYIIINHYSPVLSHYQSMINPNLPSWLVYMAMNMGYPIYSPNLIIN